MVGPRSNDHLARELYRHLLRLNREINLAKFAIDDDDDVVLTVELPTEEARYVSMKDALEALAYYADRHRRALCLAIAIAASFAFLGRVSWVFAVMQTGVSPVRPLLEATTGVIMQSRHDRPHRGPRPLPAPQLDALRGARRRAAAHRRRVCSCVQARLGPPIGAAATPLRAALE